MPLNGTDHAPVTVLQDANDPSVNSGQSLERAVTRIAAVAARHQDWLYFKQLFLATFGAERMIIEFPELVTERQTG